MRLSNIVLACVLAVLGAVVVLPGAGAQILDVPVVPLDSDAGVVEEPETPVASSSSASVDGALRGLFRIEEGECAGGPITTGSYFRMVQQGGNPETGPFLENTGSPCGDGTYTPLRPGTDGGLSTTGYQPNPDQAFDTTGHGTNDKITQPQSFFGTRFSTATNPTDPQSGTDVAIPVIVHESGSLTGDLRAFAAAWNRQHFNQGSPKPSGERPGNTDGPTGTFHPATRAYTITWSSQIVGGPFNNFTGVWHFAGTFDGSVDVGTAAPAGHAAPAPEVQGAAATAGGGGGGRTAGSVTDPTPRTGASSVPAGLALVLLAVLMRRFGASAFVAALRTTRRY